MLQEISVAGFKSIRETKATFNKIDEIKQFRAFHFHDTSEQFILTTHNPLILDWMLVEGIYLLYRQKENGQV